MGDHPDVVYLSAMRVPPGVPGVLNYYDEQEGYLPDTPVVGRWTYEGVSWVYFKGEPGENKTQGDRPNNTNELPGETIDLAEVTASNCVFTFSYDAFELVFDV
jgi:hypothetical protein